MADGDDAQFQWELALGNGELAAMDGCNLLVGYQLDCVSSLN